MNKRPGHVNVTVETGYCNFCGRTRNLRREDHQLGTLVRTIITCESCHRTLSSEIGLASPEPEAAEAAPLQPQAATTEAPAPAVPRPTANAPAPAKAKAPTKAAAKAKPAAAKRPAKPASPAAGTKAPTRRSTTKKK
jgi:uncharacterized membrane protein